MKEWLKSVYEKKYKLLLVIPFLLLIAAFLQIGIQYSLTGDFVNKGITLKGGSTVTIDYDGSIDPEQLKFSLRERFSKADLTVRTTSAGGQISSIAIDSDAQSDQEVKIVVDFLKTEFSLDETQISVEIIGSSLGKSFFKQTIVILLVAFFLMGLVVFFYFRTLAPSLTVMIAAFSDIVVTLSIFNLTGMKLSSAGIAAFLMLIDYSVDTDMLLSSRMLKRTEQPVMKRIYGAMKTGLTMSITTLVVIVLALIFIKSEIVKQIMVILFIGLLVDFVMTYIQNVCILRIYLEKNGSKN